MAPWFNWFGSSAAAETVAPPTPDFGISRDANLTNLTVIETLRVPLVSVVATLTTDIDAVVSPGSRPEGSLLYNTNPTGRGLYVRSVDPNNANAPAWFLLTGQF